MCYRIRIVNMSDTESIEVIYETESVTWESEDEEPMKTEEAEKEKKEEEKEKEAETLCPDSPEKEAIKLPRVKSLIIHGPKIISPQYPVGIRAPYRHQIELRARNREMLLCESYSDQSCVWQASKGRLLLYIPRTTDHERSKNWYVYPALRIFPGRASLNFNLELAPKVKPVFDSKSLMFVEALLHVKYRPNRRKGVRLTKGMLFGNLYIHEMWEQYHTNMDMGVSLYCPKCEKVGHMAMYCAENRQSNRIAK